MSISEQTVVETGIGLSIKAPVWRRQAHTWRRSDSDKRDGAISLSSTFTDFPLTNTSDADGLHVHILLERQAELADIHEVLTYVTCHSEVITADVDHKGTR